MRYARVKEIITNYINGNLSEVYKYLTSPDIIIEPNSWAKKIKIAIENKQFETAKNMIELVAYKFYYLK